MTDLEKIKALGRCDPPCKERYLALVADPPEFGPARVLGGWVFRDGPYRRMDENILWRSRYFGEPEPTDHTGNPYTWVNCPFCGGTLPDPPNDEGLEDDDDG